MSAPKNNSENEANKQLVQNLASRIRAEQIDEALAFDQDRWALEVHGVAARSRHEVLWREERDPETRAVIAVHAKCGVYENVFGPRRADAPPLRMPYGGGLKAETIDAARLDANFAEWDAEPAPTNKAEAIEAIAAPLEGPLAQALAQGLPVPTSIIASGWPADSDLGDIVELGKGPQCIWSTDRPYATADDHARVQRALVHALGADPAHATTLNKRARCGGVIARTAQLDTRHAADLSKPYLARVQAILHLGPKVPLEAMLAWADAHPAPTEAPAGDAEPTTPPKRRGRPSKGTKRVRADQGGLSSDLPPTWTFHGPDGEALDRRQLAELVATAANGRVAIFCPTDHEGQGDSSPGAFAALELRKGAGRRLRVTCPRCRTTWWPGESSADAAAGLRENHFSPESPPLYTRERSYSGGLSGDKWVSLAEKLSEAVGPGATSAALTRSESDATAPLVERLTRWLGSKGGIVADGRPMGWGKTQLISAYVAQLRARDPGAVVLSLNPLVSQVEALGERLALESYRNFRGPLEGSVAVTFDSSPLWRGDRLDVLVLDELEASLRRVAAWGEGGAKERERGTLAKVWPKLVELISRAKVVIVADALLTPETIAMVGAIRHAAKVETQTLVLEGAEQERGILSVLVWPTFPRWLAEVARSVGEGQRWAIATTAKTTGRQLREFFQARGKRVFLIDAEENSADRARNLDKIVERLKPDVFVYSPAITASVSMQTKWFHRRGLVDTYHGVAADDVAQMLARVRAVGPGGEPFADVVCSGAPGDEEPAVTDAGEILEARLAEEPQAPSPNPDDAALLALWARQEARKAYEQANRLRALREAFERARFPVAEVAADAVDPTDQLGADPDQDPADGKRDPLKAIAGEWGDVGELVRAVRRADVVAALSQRVPESAVRTATKRRGRFDSPVYTEAERHASRIAETYGNHWADAPVGERYRLLDFDGFGETGNKYAQVRTRPGDGQRTVARLAMVRAGPELSRAADRRANAKDGEGGGPRGVRLSLERAGHIAEAYWEVLRAFGIDSVEQLFGDVRIDAVARPTLRSVRDMAKLEQKRVSAAKRKARRKGQPTSGIRPKSRSLLESLCEWGAGVLAQAVDITCGAASADPQTPGAEGSPPNEELAELLRTPQGRAHAHRLVFGQTTDQLTVTVNGVTRDVRPAVLRLGGASNARRKQLGATIGCRLEDPGEGPDKLLLQVALRLGLVTRAPDKGKPWAGWSARNWALAVALSERQTTVLRRAADGKDTEEEQPELGRAEWRWAADNSTVATHGPGGIHLQYGRKNIGTRTGPPVGPAEGRPAADAPADGPAEVVGAA
ncbi:MAG: hypothetical protein IPG45_06025 [Deltaproteobacteria bacterium]|nr:hypothetical protein [Deltaproteobacteria bacterium]